MNLLLPRNIADRIIDALLQAGAREIGGILMGEHVGPDTFRVQDITIQHSGGTFAAFTRLVDRIIGPLRVFFRATNFDYTRFNYIGEWHSHHSFALRPSGSDHDAMREIVADSKVGAQFAVLLLVKLDRHKRLDLGLTVYQPDIEPVLGKVVCEEWYWMQPK